MYTRCPSCRSEICFDAPANVESLPDGYKHRIKCPCCGVTIGVKINKVDTSVQPTYNPYNPQPLDQPAPYAGVADVAPVAPVAKVKPAKKSGLPRNLFILILSLALIAMSIVGYFVNTGAIEITEDNLWVNSFSYFDGISAWENLIDDPSSFSPDASLKQMLIEGYEQEGQPIPSDEELDEMVKEYYAEMPQMKTMMLLMFVMELAPMILFVIACLNFVVALISCIGKKYSRAYNKIFSFITFLLAVIVLVAPLMTLISGGMEGVSGFGDLIKAYFLDFVLEGQQYLLLVGAGLGLIQWIASFIFCFGMKRKQK